uniref:CS012 protein n=1 Tax=Pavo cristatus TaxID=9049 RepID=A0A8C9G7L4_PAVCR
KVDLDLRERLLKCGRNGCRKVHAASLSHISHHFLGGALGGLLGAWMNSAKFKPVPQILMELPPAERQKLYIEAIAVLKSLDWSDFARLTAVVMNSHLFQLQLAKLLENYFTREQRAVIMYGE